MPNDETPIVREAFAAFAARDLERLEALCSVDLVVTNPPTGSAFGQQRYEGRGALAQYLSDVEQVWDRLELQPETFHCPRPGEVLVAGVVVAQRAGTTQVLSAAWSWSIVGGEIASVRVLPAGTVQVASRPAA
jgi:ketosteroid isomerase-like protein